MKARLNEDGYLEIQRNGEWVQQLCIRGTKFDGGKTFCGDDCPLMDKPKVSDEGVHTLACCQFEIGLETPLYEGQKE